MNHHRLGLSQFQEAIAVANRHFALIRQKYPNLRAYLVLSLRGGQTKPDSELVNQSDDLVNRYLTTQTSASIKIVLGTISLIRAQDTDPESLEPTNISLVNSLHSK